MFIQSEKKLRPEAAALLTEEELALVVSAKKPRQVSGPMFCDAEGAQLLV